MPKVSVIISTYNRANLIIDSIQSVLSQTFEDFEVIIIDGSSTDNTREVVGSFEDNRIKYIYQENRGICGPRNSGINASSGEYITILGSDDALLNTALEKHTTVMDAHDEAGLSYGQKYIMDERGQVFTLVKTRHRKPGAWRGTKEIINFFRHGNYISPSQTMVRSSTIKAVGLMDPSFSSGSEDFDLWVRIAKRYAVSYIAEPVVKFRVHSSSISAGRALAEFEEAHSRILESVFNDTSLGSLFSSMAGKQRF